MGSVTVNVDATGSAVEGDDAQASQLGQAIGITVQQNWSSKNAWWSPRNDGNLSFIDPDYGAQKQAHRLFARCKVMATRQAEARNSAKARFGLCPLSICQADSDTIETFLDARADVGRLTGRRQTSPTHTNGCAVDKSIPLNRATIQATFRQVFEPWRQLGPLVPHFLLATSDAPLDQASVCFPVYDRWNLSGLTTGNRHWPITTTPVWTAIHAYEVAKLNPSAIIELFEVHLDNTPWQHGRLPLSCRCKCRYRWQRCFQRQHLHPHPNSA